MAKLSAHALTFLAEELGRRRPCPLRYLAVLARHPDPIVREGVVYGLAGCARDFIFARELLYALEISDENALVRQAAAEALED